MRLNFKAKPRIDTTKWHHWFAWHPVIIRYLHGYNLVWLEKVERKVKYGYAENEYDYRDISSLTSR